MDIKNIGKTIAEQRKKHNMSQKDLADKLNVSNKTISKWECGNGIPDIESLDKLARAFGLTMDELLNPSLEIAQPENVETPTESAHISATPTIKNKSKKLLISLIISCSLVFVTAASLLCYFFIPRTPEIVSTDKFYVDEQTATVSCTVDNAIEQFSFSDCIEVPMTNKWNVYYDLNGLQVINSQTVNLQVGDNTFYIIVENSAGKKKTYQVIVRRKPLYVVTFNTNGGETIVNEIVMEDNFATYQEPVREGYIFNSWDFDFTQPITQNITVNATWIPKNLTITYYANNGTEATSTQAVTYDDTISFKTENEFSKEGYTLSGWNTKADGSGTQYSVYQNFNNFQVSETDFDLYAQWTVNQYTIAATKNLQNAGTVSGTGSFDYGTVQTLSAITNTGYTWDGWYTKDNTLVTSSQTLTVTIGDEVQEYIAKWTANKYNVSLNVNGGNAISETTKELVFGDSYVLPIPTRTEAVFLGWFDIDNNKYTNDQGVSVENWGVANTVTLYAHYKINEYQVSLSENIDGGGVVIGAGLNEYDSNVTITAQPKAGYSFVGWYNGTTLVSSLAEYSFTMPNTPISYTAHWEANDYTVTMDVNGGKELVEDSKAVTYDSSYTLAVPEKDGYDFAGWYTGNYGTGTQLTDSLGNSVAVWNIADHTTVYAKWKAIDYVITYILNGGTNNSTNPSTYNIENPDIPLNYPTKIGYSFNGWVTQGADNAEKDLVIPAGSFGAKTFAASWVRGASFVPISTPQELQNIKNDTTGYYYLTRDIDMAGIDWECIPEFYGILEGNNYSIKNFSFEITTNKTNGFILVNSGIITNLRFNQVSMTGNSNQYFGFIACMNTGTIKNCHINGFINYGGNTDFGLIVGYNDFKGKVLYCASTGEIIGSSSAIGGIVGNNSGGLIKGSYSTATINATSTSFSGGICGINHIIRFTDLGEFKGTIDGCYFAGKLENGIQQCGIAYNNGGILKNCFADCIIVAGSTNYDISNGAITNSYSTNAFATHENINVTGSLTPATYFKDDNWVKQNIKFGEFVNEAQLWMNPDNVWVFTEDEFPKLYWEA